MLYVVSVLNKYQPVCLCDLNFCQILPCLFCLLTFWQVIPSSWNDLLYQANSDPLFKSFLQSLPSNLCPFHCMPPLLPSHPLLLIQFLFSQYNNSVLTCVLIYLMTISPARLPAPWRQGPCHGICHYLSELSIQPMLNKYLATERMQELKGPIFSC